MLYWPFFASYVMSLASRSVIWQTANITFLNSRQRREERSCCQNNANVHSVFRRLGSIGSFSISYIISSAFTFVFSLTANITLSYSRSVQCWTVMGPSTDGTIRRRTTGGVVRGRIKVTWDGSYLNSFWDSDSKYISPDKPFFDTLCYFHHFRRIRHYIIAWTPPLQWP